MDSSLDTKRYHFIVAYSDTLDFETACDKARLTPEERDIFANDNELHYDMKELEADKKCSLMGTLNELLNGKNESAKLEAFKAAITLLFPNKSVEKSIKKDAESVIRKFVLVGKGDEAVS